MANFMDSIKKPGALRSALKAKVGEKVPVKKLGAKKPGMKAFGKK